MRSRVCILAFAVFLALPSSAAFGMERFPPPDFESHEMPQTVVPSRRGGLHEYLDVAVLVAALSLASYLALRQRSRRWLFVLMLFSLAYFGFWRKGCVCSVGAIQNVTLALADSGYAPPLPVIAFFLLPLVFTLFLGRVFCASVCPLGAIQDVVVFRPIKVPAWVEHSLGLLAYVYLGAAVLFAATGSAFLICRYDPFVSFFRLSGSMSMLILGASFVVIGMFVGRPYCRYLCPYGVLLRLASKVSKWHVTIAPEECIRCRLCEDACPFGAILKPNKDQTVRDHTEGAGRLALLLVLLPVLVALGVWLGGYLGTPLSKVHATVRLAERVWQEEEGLVKGTTDASNAFRKTGRPSEKLHTDAAELRGRFVTGGRLLAGWVGLVIGLKLIALSVRRTRADYEPDRAKCFSCGRCFRYCPTERDRLKKVEGERASLPARAGAG